MNRIFTNINTVVIALVVGFSSFSALASDMSPSDRAYQHYICNAFEQFGADGANLKFNCATLADDGFDLKAWQDANPERADALQQKALTIFR